MLPTVKPLAEGVCMVIKELLTTTPDTGASRKPDVSVFLVSNTHGDTGLFLLCVERST
jgi:hypothetical protein